MIRMDEFTLAYFETALWSTTDESDESGGEPLDANYGIEDFAPETSEKMIADCVDFQERFGQLIEDDESPEIEEHGRWELAGHDFWLTRNGGVGFWAGGWPKHGDELTKAAHEYGEFYLYVGDDGLIYAVGHERAASESAAARRPVVPRHPPRQHATPRGRGAHQGREEARRGSSHSLSARTGEVIPSKRWENKTTGATASIYGAVPWTGAPGDREEDWELKTVGWTIRWSDGTTGIGRQPFKSRREAQDWLNKYNAQHGIAERRRRRH